jgi:hypothetical protein
VFDDSSGEFCVRCQRFGLKCEPHVPLTAQVQVDGKRRRVINQPMKSRRKDATDALLSLAAPAASPLPSLGLGGTPPAAAVVLVMAPMPGGLGPLVPHAVMPACVPGLAPRVAYVPGMPVAPMAAGALTAMPQRPVMLTRIVPQLAPNSAPYLAGVPAGLPMQPTVSAEAL